MAKKTKLELTWIGKENLLCGIEYYRSRAEHFIDEKRNRFLDDLRSLREALERMTLVKPLNE